MTISLLCCLLSVLLTHRATDVRAQSTNGSSTVFVTEDYGYTVELQVGSLSVNATISSNLNSVSIVNCSLSDANSLGATPVGCTESVCTTNGFNCGGTGCAYNFSGSSILYDVFLSSGTLYRGTFGLPSRTSRTIFACDDAPTAPAILSLNRGPLSFLMQLGEGNRVFSYCFPPPTQYNSTGYIFFGKSSFSSSAFSTPILVNSVGSSSSNLPFYYVGLTSISVNGAQLQIPSSAFEIQDGSVAGGTILDSLVSVTLLVPSAYGPLKEAIVDAVGLSPLTDVPEGYDLCYNASVNIPDTKVTFTVQSTPPGNITVGKSELWFINETNLCFTIWNASAFSSLPLPFNVLGTPQLSNLHIQLDSDNMIASIEPSVNCT